VTTPTNLVVAKNVAVPMRDGTVLRADVYRPAEGRHPVLVMRTPYSKDVPYGLMVVLNYVRAAEAGYVVVVQDVRGRFQSEGEFVPFVNEGADGYDTVEWAAAQDWSSGSVGMFGSSYMAATQLQAAATSPPHLCAIAPMEGSADYFEGRSYKGGAFELGALLSISLFALSPGSIQRRGLRGEPFRRIWRDVRAFLEDLPGMASTAPLTDLKQTVLGEWAPFFFDWMDHDAPDPYWDSMSVAAAHEKIAVPALHVSSWFDTYAVGAIANYLGIKSKGATLEARENQYLWLGPWGHYMPRTVLNGVARLGDMNFGLGALVDLDLVQLAWFDRWLKHDVTAWSFRSPVRLFFLGANTWREEAAWPVPADVKPFFLAHDGKLSVRPASASPPDVYRSDPARPVPTLGGAHLMLESAFPQGPWRQNAIEERDDVVVYTTDPLADDVDVIGVVTLEAWVTSSAPSTDVAAMLNVVRADGRSINLVDGIRRAELPGDQPAKVIVELGPIAHRFSAGERIRLRIAGSNFPRHDLNPHTGGRPSTATTRLVAEDQIHHDDSHRSALLLPVVAGTLDGLEHA